MSDITRYWFDTEFMEDGTVIELLSIGVVCEDGREFYAENADADLSHANDWVRENVIPHLWSQKLDKRDANMWSRDGGKGGLLSRDNISRYLRTFVAGGAPNPEFWGYYCVAPETRVLTADLRWVDAGGVITGDLLMGFDEEGVAGAGRSRRWRCWRQAKVERTEVIERPCYDLTFEDGTQVRVSAEHGWLTVAGKAARWVATENLRCGPGLASHVVKPVDTWDTEETWGAGYLAAAFDGEGHLTQTDLTGTPRGVARTRTGFSQRNNEMLEVVWELLAERGYRVSGGWDLGWGVHQPLISTRSDVLRFLGSIRPLRLLSQFDPDVVGAMSLRTVRLTSKTAVGLQPVVALKTSTGTYLAEGLASHNCDYDWVVLCQLFGRMIDLPEGWPMFAMDLKQECVRAGNPTLPPQTGTEHHALEDARWTRDAWLWLRGLGPS